ncbi:hypothetical protein DID75_01795 [Candidatus Marinamargulisbacteria bacterium SCGC AG-410-N11]|nr:hypothetical protein DID75_01795 [Candidatus Marinamargulisbacteria bacterium SCGC AG-410-N11]
MIKIHTIVVSDFYQNARIIYDTTQCKCCIIDPGANINALVSHIDFSIYTVESIFLTHCHIDHAGGVIPLLNELKKYQREKVTLYYHSKEIIIGENIENYGKAIGLPDNEFFNAPKPDILVDTIDTFKVGAITAQVLATPGHSPGHVSLFFSGYQSKLSGYFSLEQSTDSPILIAGDCLFRESIGRTDLPFSSHQDLMSSIKDTLFKLPKETIVLSGHGHNTTIGHEKEFNPFIN